MRKYEVNIVLVSKPAAFPSKRTVLISAFSGSVVHLLKNGVNSSLSRPNILRKAEQARNFLNTLSFNASEFSWLRLFIKVMAPFLLYEDVEMLRSGKSGFGRF